MGTQIEGNLFWLVNGSDVAMYSFRETDIFPYNLSNNTPLDGVIAAVTSASENPPGSWTIDITSVLSARDTSVLNATFLWCETTIGFSDILSVKVKSLSKLVT